MENLGVGFLLLIIAGVINGGFTLPMKYTRQWAWENTWLMFSIFALFVLPPLCTFLTVPHLPRIYSAVGLGPVLLVMTFGAIWGIAQVLLGLAVHAVGMSLAFAIILGICAAVGSLIPLIRFHADKVMSPGGLGVIVGIVLMVTGVGFCARAGHLREGTECRLQPKGGGSFAWGLALCVISGLTVAAINFGLAFGQKLVVTAQSEGASPIWAPNAVWLPLMLAGGIPNLLYSFYLLRKNKTMNGFSLVRTGHYHFFALLMAICWFGSTLMYGMAVQKMGSWGTILGWPVFMALILITAGALGVLSGEWNHAPKRALPVQIGGVALLILAVFELAMVSRRL